MFMVMRQHGAQCHIMADRCGSEPVNRYKIQQQRQILEAGAASRFPDNFATRLLAFCHLKSAQCSAQPGKMISHTLASAGGGNN